MNPDDVVDKTELGLHEVKTKAIGLSPRLRGMLIMIDGRRTVAQLQASAAQAGAPADFLDQLLEQGLVQVRAAPARSGSSTRAGAPRAADARGPDSRLPDSRLDSRLDSRFPDTRQSDTRAPEPGSEAPAPEGSADAVAAERVRAAQRFMNDTVVDALGFRAFFFTLKLERCYSRDDLLQLMDEYTRVITKASGADAAQLLTEKARSLLQ